MNEQDHGIILQSEQDELRQIMIGRFVVGYDRTIGCLEFYAGSWLPISIELTAEETAQLAEFLADELELP